ncbi:mRNA export protein mlo3 [Wallemia ichthyophaga EXF-994]|uniref:mRNA export protein mlo3 n=1 Tax=Wallemia ichthyophaga (strain EXF-994 / CBS 113033) TaxID=1299270 RepID=R9AFF0_WALI9|nr:mRNA export protein mlo3 [Wallemia ichthyophaga EXF-994]EOR00845.1 mRNA export protein mlo3 [Wallemia ichthyophaga EXF-994]
MNIDQPLEDVIKAKRQERKSHRKTTQRKRLSGAKQGESKRMAQGAKPVADRVIPRTKDGAALNEEAKKIIISNLPPDVNDHALKELMTETVGPVAECSISYDQRGTSKGFGQVRFKRKGDGNKAFKEFNGRVIDNNSLTLRLVGATRRDSE